MTTQPTTMQRSPRPEMVGSSRIGWPLLSTHCFSNPAASEDGRPRRSGAPAPIRCGNNKPRTYLNGATRRRGRPDVETQWPNNGRPKADEPSDALSEAEVAHEVVGRSPPSTALRGRGPGSLRPSALSATVSRQRVKTVQTTTLRGGEKPPFGQRRRPVIIDDQPVNRASALHPPHGAPYVETAARLWQDSAPRPDISFFLIRERFARSFRAPAEAHFLGVAP